MISNQKNSRTRDNKQYQYAHLIPLISEIMKNVCCPANQMQELLKIEAIRFAIMELAIIVELINICNGREVTNGFIKCFPKHVCREGWTDSQMVFHLTTLLYFDERAMLTKKVIQNETFPRLSANEAISLVGKTVYEEALNAKNRQSSDNVKIVGGSKKATIIPFEEVKENKKGEAYVVEAAHLSQDEVYAALEEYMKDNNSEEIVSEYFKDKYRKDRANNLYKVIEYITAQNGADVERINITDLARETRLSRKTCYALLENIKKDAEFKRLIGIYQKNKK